MKLKEITIPQWLAIAAVTLFAGIFALEQIYNYDLWWHLRSGEWILENGRIPFTEPFTFSTEGALWSNTAWLGGVVFALIHRLGGLDSLIIFKALLIGLSFGGACLYLIRQGVNLYLAVLVLGYAIVVARFRFLLRPLVFMFPFGLLLFWVLAGPASRKEKLSFLLLPFTIFWVNLHGSAYLAPVFAGILYTETVLNSMVERWKNKAPVDFPVFGLLLVASLAAAILMTPFGYNALRYVFDIVVMGDILTQSLDVEEHLPLVWQDHKMYSALLVVTAASFLANWRKTRLLFLLIFFATAWMSLSSVRFVGLASFFQGIFLCLNLQSTFERMRVGQKITLRKYQHFIFPPVVLFGAIFGFQSTFTPEKVYQWGLGVNSSRYPVAAVNFLVETSFKGNLFNAWVDGGYLLWHLPESRTFIDGRGLPAQLELQDRFGKLSRQELSSYLESNNVQAALLPKSETRLATVFEMSPQYSLGYFDEKYLVYLRQDVAVESSSANQSLVFKYIRLQGYDYAYLEPLAKGVNAGEVEKELRQALIVSPDNFSLYFQLAFFLDVQNRPEAADYYLQAARLNPSLGFSHFNLDVFGGRAALRHRQWNKTIELLRMALDNAKDGPEIYFMLGTSQYQLKDYAAAEKNLLLALKSNPENGSVLLNLAFVYFDAGDFADAEKTFSKIISTNPRHEGARYGHALALHQSANPLAFNTWQEFLKDFPESQRTEAAQRYIAELGKGSQ